MRHDDCTTVFDSPLLSHANTRQDGQLVRICWMLQTHLSLRKVGLLTWMSSLATRALQSHAGKSADAPAATYMMQASFVSVAAVAKLLTPWRHRTRQMRSRLWHADVACRCCTVTTCQPADENGAFAK